MKSFSLVVLLAASITSAFATDVVLMPKRAWDEPNSPYSLFSQYESNLAYLPRTGKSKSTPWSDTYWPSAKGGIAYRWQKPVDSSKPFNYRLNSWKAVSKMTTEEINSLSPAEKYDILMGDYSYPTVRRELQRTHSNDQSWFGLCHAVAVTSTQFPEPQIKNLTFRLPDGKAKQITFYSSDTKALLAEYVNENFPGTPTMGRRCESATLSNNSECWDVNPGSFFIAITNVIGLLRDPVVLDVDVNNEVWNSAAFAYDYTLAPKKTIGRNAARGTVKEYTVTMNVYNNKGATPRKAPNGSVSMKSTYLYTIEIDRLGNVIGGEWITEKHPDFVWMSNKVIIAPGYYGALNDLVR